MRTIAIVSLIGAIMIIASCVAVVGSAQEQKPAAPEKKVAPTAPVAIERFHIGIVDATEDETRIIKNSLGFIAARTPQIFEEHYCREIVMRNSDGHFYSGKTRSVAAHYEPIAKIICITHGNIEASTITHEIEHACTMRCEASTEGRARLASWEAITKAVYDYSRYKQLGEKAFPFLTFPSLYATHDALEHRAEWKRWLYLLLYEKYLVSVGELMPFDTAYNYNPLHRLKPNATWRAMLKWSLDGGDITHDDYRSVEADFSGGE